MREGTLNKQAFVLPAFETAHHPNETRAHELADSASGMTKEQLAPLVKKRLVYQFAQYLFWQVRLGVSAKRVLVGRGSWRDPSLEMESLPHPRAAHLQ